MSRFISRQQIALLALLWSSTGFAATVTIVASNLAPNVGEQFTLTVSGDVENTFAATMALAFDDTKVTFIGGDMPAAGPWSAANGGAFIKNSPTTENPTVFDIVTNNATTPGTYDAVILTFQAIASGSANILINDDGGNCCGWFDAVSADYIPVTYTQADVIVAAVTATPVTTDIAGTHGNSEGACTQASKDAGFDCTYGGTNLVGTASGWSGPNLGGTYFAAGSVGDSADYVPAAGDAKINPEITGSLTITGTDTDATVSGSIVVGPAVRNVATGAAARAVQRWTSITHTLPEILVSSATPNGAGGFDYVIGSRGVPEQICLAGGGACFGAHETGSDPTAGPADSWGVAGVGGDKPSVGIEAVENLAGVTATGTTDQRNLGAMTSAVIAGASCDATVAGDCASSPVVWGGGEDPGFDNLILAISTDAAGKITAGRAYWTQDYQSGNGGSDDATDSGTFEFAASDLPGCVNFTANVIEGSSNNAIDAPANCSNFTSPVTITIVTPPNHGTATVSGGNSILYTPDPGFSGSDTLTYNGDDGTSNDDGVLTINVAPDLLAVAPDGAITISTQGVDPVSVTGTLDVATLATYSAGNLPTTVTVSNATNGVTSINGTTVSYTLNANAFAGSDTFTYTLVDSDGDTAQGTVTVTADNLTPTVADVAINTDQDEASAAQALTIVAGNGSPAQHTLAVTTNGTNGACTLTASDATGQVIYTPDPGYFGADSCVLTLTDGNGDSDTAAVSVTVNERVGTIVIDGGSSAVDPASLALLGGLPILLRRRRKAAAMTLAAAATASVLASPSAMADGSDRWDWDYDGLYLGAGVIGTSIKTSDKFNTSLQQELDLLNIESSGRFEDFPIGGQLYAGWMFNRYFGIEGRWSDSGTGDSDILFEDNLGNRSKIGKLEASIDGWTVYGVANWPVAPRFDLFGKLGYTDQNADFKGSIDGSEGGGSFSDSTDDSGFAAALGARWRFARHWAATVEGEYLDVDFDNAVDQPWRVGLNVEYWFGGHETPVPVAAAVAAPVVAPPPPPPPPPPARCLDGDGDGVCDPADQCPTTSAGARVDVRGCDCEVTRQVNFKFNSADLTDEGKQVLDEMAENLTRLGFVDGTIEGHTDSVGDEAYNQGLSERRARTVADYLQAKGIAPGRLQIEGFGETRPIADNSTAEGRAQNRRVVARRTDCDK